MIAKNWRAGRSAAAFLLALVLLGQGITAPFAKDAEPQSAQWIADIVQHGHWLVPSDYYGFVDRKPPLYYWLSALVARAANRDINEVRARVVALVAAAALAAIVLEWTAATLTPATGGLAYFFLAGSYGFASRAITALTDMLMTMLLFTTYCLVGRMLDEARPSWRAIGGAGATLGLAILTKGPVVMVLLVLAVAIECALTRRRLRAIASWTWPWATLLTAVMIAALWYTPAAIAGRASGLPGVFFNENIGHFMPARLGGTGEAARPVYYIVVRLMGGIVPLFILVPAAVWSFRRDGFIAAARRPLNRQLALLLAVVLLFSAASAKRDDYILPAIPPLMIILAALFTTLHAGEAGRRSVAALLRDGAAGAIAVVILLGLAGALVWVRSGITIHAGRALQTSDASYAGIFLHGLAMQQWTFVGFELVMAVASISTLTGLLQGRVMLTGGGLAAIALAGAILWNGVIRPAELRSRSLVDFAAQVRAQVGDAPIYVAYFDPEFAWYFGRGVPPLPTAFAQGGAPDATTIYFVARPWELVRLALPVRQRLRVIARTELLGGGGPPALYAIPPPQRTNLKVKPPAAAR